MTTIANEEIIYAPIEIESADQLHALGATWEDCKTWRIGVTPVKVILVPADQETRDFLIQDLRRKYVNRNRQTRCQVPGKYNRPVTCPAMSPTGETGLSVLTACWRTAMKRGALIRLPIL